jgi:serine carboxypeptidase-like clade 2
MNEYRRILANRGVKVWLFSGDWDDVVPFTDTEQNVEVLARNKVGEWNPWNVGDQHAGFYQLYENRFTVITVRGGSHMVPQSKPKPMYQLFYNFVNGKGVNNQVF